GRHPDQIRKQTEEANRVASRSYEQQQRKAEATYDRITDYAGNAFADLFLDTEGGWKRTMENLQRVAIAAFAKIAFEAAARPIIMPVVQQFTGGGGAAGSAMQMAGSGMGGGSAAQVAGNGGIGQYTKYLDGSLLSLGTGGSPTGGIVRFIDTNLGTGIGSFLNSPAYTVGGNAQLAAQLGPYADTGMTVGSVGSSVNGVQVPWGSAIGGTLGFAAGAYGLYNAIQTGGPKGWAQGVGSTAGMVAGASTAAFGTTSAAGVSAGLTGMGVGSGVAGALGAVAAVAPYIAAIAAIVAMFLPGQKPSDKTGTATWDPATGGIAIGGLNGDRFSQENRDQAQGIANALGDLNKSIAQLADLQRGVVDASFRVGVGARDGMTVDIAGQRQVTSADEAGAKAITETATIQFLRQAFAQATDANVRQVLIASGFNAERGLEGLDFYRNTYSRFLNQEDPAQLTQYAQAVKQVTDLYNPMIEKAREYGLALAPIAEVMDRQLAKLVEMRSLQFDQMMAGYQFTAAQLRGDPDTILRMQLSQFDLQRTADYLAMAEQIRQIGFGAEQVAVATRAFDEMKDLQRQALIEQTEAAKAQQAAAAAQEASAAAGTAAGGISSLTDYARGLRYGDASPLGARAQYEAAQREFQAVLGAAQAGDWNSISQLQSYSDTFLSSSRGVNGSGTGYVADFQRVTEALGSIAGMGADRLTASVLAMETRTQTQVLLAELQALRAEVARLREETVHQNRRPARAA
ncbi:hypothetical protein OH543_0023510, partial [Roseomonas sp. SXEYE001]|nr:hypothetical protein [Roseomonas sp. SXEYE001]